LSKEDTPIDFPKPQLVQEGEKKKITTKQYREPSLEVLTKEQFINEQQSMRSISILP
jgi:hypothetical protein